MYLPTLAQRVIVRAGGTDAHACFYGHRALVQHERAAQRRVAALPVRRD